MTENYPSNEQFEQAVKVLKEGGVVGFPTETYYGLGVDIFNEQAVHSLFHLKKRDYSKPILVLISDLNMLSGIVSEVPSMYENLMEHFWPGPLTLIFPASANLSSLITGSTNTVGVRISPHPVAAELCRRWGRPLTATSANLSGSSPAASAGEVAEIFSDRIDYVVDGGKTPGNKCSTVVGMDENGLCLIRPGQVEFREIKATLLGHLKGSADIRL